VTAASGASIAGVLSLVEKHGTVVILARSLEKVASVDARAALHAAGVIAAAPAAPSWPCDVRGCSREVRSNHDGARKPLVAVCFQVPAVCTPVELGFDDVAQQEISVEALLVAACALLGASVDRAAMAKVRERRALGESRAPVLVAAVPEAPQARDVFWAGSPRDTDLSAWCARRERAARRTLILVPTAKYVSLEVASRFARGEAVEIRALDALLEVRDGKLALVPDDGARIEAVPAPAPAPAPAPIAQGIAALLGATRWEDIRITVVDGHTVRIEANGKGLLRTFVELGFVDGRKSDIVTPIASWGLFVLFCKKGRLKPSAYGEQGHKPFGVKKAIEKIGESLREAFGLADHPLHAYSKRSHLWATRFKIAAESP
jgi:hypothetical protein